MQSSGCAPTFHLHPKRSDIRAQVTTIGKAAPPQLWRNSNGKFSLAAVFPAPHHIDLVVGPH